MKKKNLSSHIIFIIGILFLILLSYLDYTSFTNTFLIALFAVPVFFVTKYSGNRYGLAFLVISFLTIVFLKWDHFFNIGNPAEFMVNSLILSLIIISAYYLGTLIWEKHLKENSLLKNESETAVPHQTKNLFDLEKIFDHLPHFIYVKDREGKILFANKNFADVFFDTEAANLIGKKIDTCDDTDVLETLTPKYMESREVTDKEGKVRFLETTIVPLYLETLNDHAILGISVDISETIEIETVLKESEQRFANFAKSAPVAFTRLNMKTGKYQFVNDEFVRQSGYELSEYEKLNDQELVEMIYEPDRESAFNEYKNWQESNFQGIKYLTYRLVNKSGNIMWLDTYTYADFDENGVPTFINQICLDVTETKKIEKSLAESEERYRAFVNQSTEGIYRIEFKEPIEPVGDAAEVIYRIYENGYIAECNDVFAKLYGFEKAEDVTGKALTEILGENSFNDNVKSFSEFLKNDLKLVNVESVEITSDGKRIAFLNNAVGIKENNKLVRIWGTQNDITRQKELLESNMMLTQAIEQSPLAVLITDSKGIVEYVNNKYVSQSGYAKEDVIKTQSEIVSNVLSSEVNSKNSSGSSLWSGEVLSVKKNRESIWEFVNISEIRDYRDIVTHYIAVLEDITEKKKIEESVRESEERYRAFINHSSEGIYRMEFDFPISVDESVEKIADHFVKHAYIAECNGIMANMYGYESAEDLIGLRVVDFMKHDSKTVASYSFESFIRSGFRINQRETREIDHNGNTHYFLNNGIGIIQDGKLMRIWGTQRDITEMKLIQEDIRKLSRAVEQSPVAIAITDTNGVIEYINEMFASLTKFQEPDLKGKKPFILMKDSDDNNLKTEIWDTIKRGDNWKGEFKNRRKDGSEYWENAIISPIRDKNGKITHYIYMKQDITERKNFENEIIKAREKAEAANKAKSEFLANMSHEIRTPMNGIVGMAQLLELTELDKDQKEYVSMMKFSSDSLLSIINDILDFSKIENNKLHLADKEYNLRNDLESIYKLHKKPAEDKGLKLGLLIDDRLNFYVMGDELRLNQILNNLLNNAIKFTNRGSVDLICRVGEKNHVTAEIIFTVKDTGIGIPEDKYSWLFESFTQLDNPYLKRHTGTGLGLAIVKRLIDMMGGYITVKSKVGVGTEFEVRIKMKVVEKQLSEL